ncbi:hypothetical protein LMG9964_05572 [Paraburkholderia phenoliruptrix]|uniref:Uncharacterized protein n=1 Tax=Paraburkholderia phenoliruptrix TaxID=252970 RepID=A0A6J5KEV2_9BURK|nr:hypothetical protein LMG9964_05572 [Paraburkholderia phenoliruptrix]
MNPLIFGPRKTYIQSTNKTLCLLYVGSFARDSDERASSLQIPERAFNRYRTNPELTTERGGGGNRLFDCIDALFDPSGNFFANCSMQRVRSASSYRFHVLSCAKLGLV